MSKRTKSARAFHQNVLPLSTGKNDPPQSSPVQVADAEDKILNMASDLVFSMCELLVDHCEENPEMSVELIHEAIGEFYQEWTALCGSEIATYRSWSEAQQRITDNCRAAIEANAKFNTNT